MPGQMGFSMDMDKCIDCRACVIAEKQWQGIEAGTPGSRRVIRVWGGKYPDVTLKFLSLSCMHCGDPACEAVCPAGAISKRAEDGIVVVDQDKCIGCHYCFFACPFGVPSYNAEGTMQKCDGCLDRQAEGKEPACVATCPTGALKFGTLDELAQMAAGKTARRLAGARQPSLILTGS